MKGRPPKPLAILKLQGTYRPDRHGGTRPQASGTPKMPRWLDKDAKEWWKRTVPKLVAMGVAGEVDTDTLASAARWFGLWRRLDRTLDGDGLNGKALREAATAWTTYYNLAGRFGLSPVEREKLRNAVAQQHEENPLEVLKAVQ